MKIEILYPELCCLFGDKANMRYLQACLPDAEFVETGLTESPVFAAETPDLVYLGSMSEQSQEILISVLAPHKERLRELFSTSGLFLMTGNALEIMGSHITREDGTEIEGLGLVDLHAVRQTPKRFNSLVVAEFGGTKIVGYTSRFSHSYMDNSANALFRVTTGVGLNPDSKLEGFHINRVYATYLLGPLLVSNPDFTIALLAELGVSLNRLPFHEAIYQAYRKKLAELQKPGLNLN